MSRNVTFAPGEYYHLYNRGTEKRDVYLDKADYTRFLILLYSCNSPEPVHLQLRGSTSNIFENLARDESFVDIGAYCLMPNHFHLLIHEFEEGGISSYLKRIEGSYAMYFNKKYEKSGYVFQGRFQSVHIESDQQLIHLSAYIHLNVRELSRWRNKEESYPWSSYQDIVLKNRWGALIKPEIFFTRFNNKNNYKKFVRSSGKIKEQK